MEGGAIDKTILCVDRLACVALLAVVGRFARVAADVGLHWDERAGKDSASRHEERRYDGENGRHCI